MNYPIIYGIITIGLIFGAVMYFIGLANGYNKRIDEYRNQRKERNKGNRPVKFIDGSEKKSFVDRRRNPRWKNRHGRNFKRKEERPTKW